MKVRFTQDERRIMAEAESEYQEKRAELEEKGESAAGFTLDSIYQAMQDTIGRIRARAMRRHFENLGGNAETIFNDAKEQAPEAIRETWLGKWVSFWDYDGASEEQKARGLDQIADEVKTTYLHHHFEALEGVQKFTEGLLTDRLTDYIKEQTRAIIDQENNMGVSLIRTLNAEKMQTIEGLRMATDMVTRYLFRNTKAVANDKIVIVKAKEEQKAEAGKKAQSAQEEQVLWISTTEDQTILPGDELVFDAVCSLYVGGFNFVTTQDIHNMIETGKPYPNMRMTQKQSNSIVGSVERLAGKRFDINISGARKYKGLDQIPEWKVREIAQGTNMLYVKKLVERKDGKEVVGWQIMEDPTTYMLASFMRHIAFLKPEALQIPFERRPKYRDALIRFLRDRAYQAYGKPHMIRCDTMYTVIGVGDKTDKVKAGARDTAEVILKHWTEVGLIKGHKLHKAGKRNTITHIEINPAKPAALATETTTANNSTQEGL